MLTQTLRNAWRLLDPRSLRAVPFRCPACGPSLLLRLSADEMGVRCEDVQHLTFASASFDLCISTEMFEHVPTTSAASRRSSGY